MPLKRRNLWTKSDKVTQEDGTQNFYTGLCSTTFKERLGIHRHSFKNRKDNQTELSKFIWALKDKGLKYEVSWRMLDRGKPFCPISGVCWLCVKEKFYILFRPNSADINSRDEILENCRHVKSKLLIRDKKKSPGWIQDLVFNWRLTHFSFRSFVLCIILLVIFKCLMIALRCLKLWVTNKNDSLIWLSLSILRLQILCLVSPLPPVFGYSHSLHS